jgi:hypothetical protein
LHSREQVMWLSGLLLGPQPLNFLALAASQMLGLRHKTHRFEEFFIIGKLLKHRCLKWARMTHCTSETQVMILKKGQKSNWQFDFQPLKVRNRHDFLVCRWHATYRWKTLDESYNFALNLITIEGLHAKLWGPKVARVPTRGISRLLGQNAIWMRPLWRGADNTIKGKVMVFPKFRPWWILWV